MSLRVNHLAQGTITYHFSQNQITRTKKNIKNDTESYQMFEN